MKYLVVGLGSMGKRRVRNLQALGVKDVAGVYVLDPAALSVLTADAHCDMPTLFERLQIKKERTVAYPMHEPWLDVGRPLDLQLANSQGAKSDHR